MPAYAQALVCSNEALAHVLRVIGFGAVGNLLGYAAIAALPSVILILLFGQTRIFFVMARDGLLPDGLSKVHPKWKTPYVVTAITGGVVAVAAAFLPVGQLADIANAGTLYAFLMVAIAVMLLRRSNATRKRAFRVPALWLIGPLTIAGCLFLFFNLPFAAMIVLPVWTVIGFVVYFGYSRSHSHLGRGIVEVSEEAAHDLAPHLPGVDDPDHKH
jgi:APA family basic amino acid/polyamine antiporter